MHFKDVELYKLLHSKDVEYGNSGISYLPEIVEFIGECDAHTVLDFGCGKGTLVSALCISDVTVHGYDPAIVGNEVIPLSSYDLVISTDVLEHLHGSEIDGIFEEMLQLRPKNMYHVVCHRLASQILPDGTNAHKTVESPVWWERRFKEFFGDYSVSFHCERDRHPSLGQLTEGPKTTGYFKLTGTS